MRIDSEDINMSNLKENDTNSMNEYNEYNKYNEYNETSLSEQVNKNMEDIEKLMVELQRSETELRRRIVKDENNKTIDINAIDDVIITLPPIPDAYFNNKERRIQKYKSYDLFYIGVFSNFINSFFGIIYWICVYLLKFND